MRKIGMWVAVLLAAALLAGSAWLGYKEWAKQKQIDGMRPHVKAASLHAAGYFSATAQPNATFGEVLRKGEQLLEKIDQSVIDLRALSGPVALPQETAALGYMAELQALARDLTRYYRGRMQARTALKGAERARGDIADAGSSYGVQAALKRMSESVEEAERERIASEQAHKAACDRLPGLEKLAAAVGAAFGQEVRIAQDQVRDLERWCAE